MLETCLFVINVTTSETKLLFWSFLSMYLNSVSCIVWIFCSFKIFKLWWLKALSLHTHNGKAMSVEDDDWWRWFEIKNQSQTESFGNSFIIGVQYKKIKHKQKKAGFFDSATHYINKPFMVFILPNIAHQYMQMLWMPRWQWISGSTETSSMFQHNT